MSNAKVNGVSGIYSRNTEIGKSHHVGKIIKK